MVCGDRKHCAMPEPLFSFRMRRRRWSGECQDLSPRLVLRIGYYLCPRWRWKLLAEYAKAIVLRRPRSAKSMSINPVDFEYLRKLMAEHTAIVLDAGKEYIAESRLANLVVQEGFDSVPALIRTLRTNAFDVLHRKVVNAMTNNETWFFRDLVPFEALRKQIIPSVLASRMEERRLSIWCAACSSGQEPYSVAMLLRENF